MTATTNSMSRRPRVARVVLVTVVVALSASVSERAIAGGVSVSGADRGITARQLTLAVGERHVMLRPRIASAQAIPPEAMDVTVLGDRTAVVTALTPGPGTVRLVGPDGEETVAVWAIARESDGPGGQTSPGPATAAPDEARPSARAAAPAVSASDEPRPDPFDEEDAPAPMPVRRAIAETLPSRLRQKPWPPRAVSGLSEGTSDDANGAVIVRDTATARSRPAGGSLVAPQKLPSLSGILTTPRGPVAILDGKPTRPRESRGPWTVEQILSTAVVVRSGDSRITLKLPVEDDGPDDEE